MVFGLFGYDHDFLFFKEVFSQACQPISGYFYGNDNSHSKGKKSGETKMGEWKTLLSPPQYTKFTLK